MQLQSVNDGLAKINGTSGAQQQTTRSSAAANRNVIDDPGHIDSLDEILRAYAAAAPVPVTDACIDHKPTDVSFYMQRANGATKVGDDITASASLRIVVARLAYQGVGVPGNSVLTACVPASQVYSPVGQTLATTVMLERHSRLISAGSNLKIDAANALALLESDPVGNKVTIDRLIATGLVSKPKARSTKKPL